MRGDGEPPSAPLGGLLQSPYDESEYRVVLLAGGLRALLVRDPAIRPASRPHMRPRPPLDGPPSPAAAAFGMASGTLDDPEDWQGLSNVIARVVEAAGLDNGGVFGTGSVRHRSPLERYEGRFWQIVRENSSAHGFEVQPDGLRESLQRLAELEASLLRAGGTDFGRGNASSSEPMREDVAQARKQSNRARKPPDATERNVAGQKRAKDSSTCIAPKYLVQSVKSLQRRFLRQFCDSSQETATCIALAKPGQVPPLPPLLFPPPREWVWACVAKEGSALRKLPYGDCRAVFECREKVQREAEAEERGDSADADSWPATRSISAAIGSHARRRYTASRCALVVVSGDELDVVERWAAEAFLDLFGRGEDASVQEDDASTAPLRRSDVSIAPLRQRKCGEFRSSFTPGTLVVVPARLSSGWYDPEGDEEGEREVKETVEASSDRGGEDHEEPTDRREDAHSCHADDGISSTSSNPLLFATAERTNRGIEPIPPPMPSPPSSSTRLYGTLAVALMLPPRIHAAFDRTPELLSRLVFAPGPGSLMGVLQLENDAIEDVSGSIEDKGESGVMLRIDVRLKQTIKCFRLQEEKRIQGGLATKGKTDERERVLGATGCREQKGESDRRSSPMQPISNALAAFDAERILETIAARFELVRHAPEVYLDAIVLDLVLSRRVQAVCFDSSIPGVDPADIVLRVARLCAEPFDSAAHRSILVGPACPEARECHSSKGDPPRGPTCRLEQRERGDALREATFTTTFRDRLRMSEAQVAVSLGLGADQVAATELGDSITAMFPHAETLVQRTDPRTSMSFFESRLSPSWLSTIDGDDAENPKDGLFASSKRLLQGTSQQLPTVHPYLALQCCPDPVVMSPGERPADARNRGANFSAALGQRTLAATAVDGLSLPAPLRLVVDSCHGTLWNCRFDTPSRPSKTAVFLRFSPRAPGANRRASPLPRMVWVELIQRIFWHAFDAFHVTMASVGIDAEESADGWVEIEVQSCSPAIARRAAIDFISTCLASFREHVGRAPARALRSAGPQATTVEDVEPFRGGVASAERGACASDDASRGGVRAVQGPTTDRCAPSPAELSSRSSSTPFSKPPRAAYLYAIKEVMGFVSPNPPSDPLELLLGKPGRSGKAAHRELRAMTAADVAADALMFFERDDLDVLCLTHGGLDEEASKTILMAVRSEMRGAGGNEEAKGEASERIDAELKASDGSSRLDARDGYKKEHSGNFGGCFPESLAQTAPPELALPSRLVVLLRCPPSTRVPCDRARVRLDLCIGRADSETAALTSLLREALSAKAPKMPKSRRGTPETCRGRPCGSHDVVGDAKGPEGGVEGVDDENAAARAKGGGSADAWAGAAADHALQASADPPKPASCTLALDEVSMKVGSDDPFAPYGRSGVWISATALRADATCTDVEDAVRAALWSVLSDWQDEASVEKGSSIRSNESPRGRGSQRGASGRSEARYQDKGGDALSRVPRCSLDVGPETPFAATIVPPLPFERAKALARSHIDNVVFPSDSVHVWERIKALTCRGTQCSEDGQDGTDDRNERRTRKERSAERKAGSSTSAAAGRNAPLSLDASEVLLAPLPVERLAAQLRDTSVSRATDLFEKTVAPLLEDRSRSTAFALPCGCAPVLPPGADMPESFMVLRHFVPFSEELELPAPPGTVLMRSSVLDIWADGGKTRAERRRDGTGVRTDCADGTRNPDRAEMCPSGDVEKRSGKNF